MGYRLADGSSIFDYLADDTFSCKGFLNDIVYRGAGSDFDISGSRPFMVCQHNMKWVLSSLYPTEETKRKVAERQNKLPDVSAVEKMLAAVFNLGDRNQSDSQVIGIATGRTIEFGEPCDAPKTVETEPLARIVDWRGGEEVKPLDFVVSNEFGVDYRAVVLEVISPTQIRTCRGLIGKSHGNLAIIRINTAAIPKQRTMTRAEVEIEFGVKVVD
jgi:hypothetical protein